MWGATLTDTIKNLDKIISIHAPRVGSDIGRLDQALNGQNFNPRSPCGERPVKVAERYTQANISIHAPRVGSDFGC